MKHFKYTLLALFLLPIYTIAQLPAPLKPVDNTRIQVIKQYLPETPGGVGLPYSERVYWDTLLKSGRFKKFLKDMRNYTFPEFSEELYFSLSKGAASSAPGLNMMRERARALSRLTWAECLENKGTYIPIIENGLRDVLQQPSWVSPRNDYQFRNYKGTEYSVELTTAMYAHTIAQLLYLLGDKIEPTLREEAVKALYIRAFNPIRKTIETQDENSRNKFLTMINNYNPVCLAGVVGAALAVIPDKEERAFFVHIGEYYSANGLMGFNDDGYCTEGVMYFNYGFENYILLRECIWQSTAGKVDLFSDPKVCNIGWYPPKIEIINDIYPPLSDCSEGEKPNYDLMYYLNHNLGMNLSRYDKPNQSVKTSNIALNIMLEFPNSTDRKDQSFPLNNKEEKIRSLFEESVVLTVRPGDNTACRMGAVFKGGTNDEQHNHNDVGTYSIVVGKTLISGDPGSIPYTGNIFNKQYRYTYKTIGSYGHPVPIIAGKEQQTGKEAYAVLVYKNFTETKDEITMDITSAYNEPSLKQLHRHFIYNRSGKGAITVTDSFLFNQAEQFETAIITRATWKQIEPDMIQLTRDKEKVNIRIQSDSNFFIQSEIIEEGGIPYTRIGIYLTDKTEKGEISLTYLPL